MKSKRTALLKKIFAGRNLIQDANELGILVFDLHHLIGDPSVTSTDTPPKEFSIQVTTQMAVEISKLTGGNARAILDAQLDDELAALGVSIAATTIEETPVKEPAVKKPRKAKPAGSRGPHGGRTSFKLD